MPPNYAKMIYDPISGSLVGSPYIDQVVADARRRVPLYGPGIPMGAGATPTYGPAIPMGPAKAGAAGAQNRAVQAITNPRLARNLRSQNRGIAAITNPDLAQRLAGQNRIVSSIANPTSLPYGATQGINMSGGVPYGAVNSARFGSGLNAAGGVGSGMYGPAIPMGSGGVNYSIPQAPPTLPYGVVRPGGISMAGATPYSTITGAGANPYGATTGISMGANATPYSAAGLQAAGQSTAARAGLLGRLGIGGPNAAGTSGVNAYLRSGLTGKAALGRLVGYPMLGYQAASAIDAINPFEYVGASKNNAFDRFAAGAAGGAGVGAAIGSILPIGITTAAGAGIGALVGGGINTIRGWFDDASKTDLSKKNQKLIDGLNPLMERAGLTDAQGAQYKTQFDIALQIMRDNGTDSPENVSKLIQDTQSQISKVAGSNAGKLTSKDMVALQAAIGQYMQPLIQQQQMSGDIASQLYNDMAGNMGGSAMANLVRGQAAGYKSQADALSAAYMAQAQSIPAIYGLQQMGQLANQQQSAQSTELLAQIQASQ